MDVIIVAPLIIILLVLKYHFTDHDTPADKERKLLAEGIFLFAKQDYAEAFTYFDQKVKENGRLAIGYAYRGKCHLVENNLYSALYDFTQALSFDNTLEDIHFDKGSVHYLLEEYHEAFLSFDKAVWFSRGKNTEAIDWRNLSQEKLISISSAQKESVNKPF